jgi:hypothetical protein
MAESDNITSALTGQSRTRANCGLPDVPPSGSPFFLHSAASPCKKGALPAGTFGWAALKTRPSPFAPPRAPGADGGPHSNMPSLRHSGTQALRYSGTQVPSVPQSPSAISLAGLRPLPWPAALKAVPFSLFRRSPIPAVLCVLRASAVKAVQFRRSPDSRLSLRSPRSLR